MESKKFCTKCGTQLSDETKFCTGCGEPVMETETKVNEQMAEENKETAEQVAAETKQPVETKQSTSTFANVKIDENKRNSIIGIVAVVVGIFVVVSIFNMIFGRSGKDVVNDYIKYAYKDPSIEKVIKLMPKKYIKAMKKEVKDSDQKWDEFIEEYDEQLEEALSMLDSFYEDWSIDYEIGDEEKWTKDEISSYEEEVKSSMDININVKAGKNITVELKILNKDKETITTNSMEIGVIKVGGKWYLDPNSMSAALY